MPVAEVFVAIQEPDSVETRDLALITGLEAPSTGQIKRFKFKIHVVNAAARVLGIIIIDHTINLLPGSHESIAANFDKLTNAAQNAVFDFATSMVSGVFDLTLIAAGVATGIASSSGIHLGGTVVAKTLHVFNENNAKIGSINL
ncbi:hypothetical protein CGCA056_v000327 [Colletotrichum aenigma]|uniref:uncharacterized protein n=1 Tax=Colletotrichum aenigma TaxID=1215731 RepID=UPI0018729B3E|nr:uncharacterized protein CGCA056_v000327 [Colletotrichum aenigma]KAF5527651.1 hypothetical protein CGCA056_v000327 [Colletotrichum aenigma]